MQKQLCLENLNVKDDYEDLDVHGRIILESILEKLDVKLWS